MGRFIVRRLIISASEDVGNADPRALQVAVAATAAEALQLIETLGSRLGGAIIDVGLPDTPGDQLVAPIRPPCLSCRS